MLLEEDYKSEMRRRGIRFGYSRGSVSGSIIAYLLGITEIDSVKYNLNFERFMNKERISLADIDTDWFSDDRKTVRDYLYGKDGLYCCDIVTFNTIDTKGAIKDVCRGLAKDNISSVKVKDGMTPFACFGCIVPPRHRVFRYQCPSKYNLPQTYPLPSRH